MSRLTWLSDVAIETGYPVVEVDDWETRGYSDGYSPSTVVAHHTAGPSGSGDMPSLGICVNGRSDLPGPLANYCLGRSGTIYVVASGKANNAGDGDWQSCDSNYCTVGIEAENDGSQPWPAVQLDSYGRLVAGILDRLGRSTSYTCGHKEWAPGRKPDPHSINMDRARSTIQAYMDDGGNMAKGPNGEPNWDEVSDWAKTAWTEAHRAGVLTEDSHPRASLEVEELMVYLKRADVI